MRRTPYIAAAFAVLALTCMIAAFAIPSIRDIVIFDILGLSLSSGNVK
jgi:hypothetical protein